MALPYVGSGRSFRALGAVLEESLDALVTSPGTLPLREVRRSSLLREGVCAGRLTRHDAARQGEPYVGEHVVTRRSVAQDRERALETFGRDVGPVARHRDL